MTLHMGLRQGRHSIKSDLGYFLDANLTEQQVLTLVRNLGFALLSTSKAKHLMTPPCPACKPRILHLLNPKQQQPHLQTMLREVRSEAYGYDDECYKN